MDVVDVIMLLGSLAGLQCLVNQIMKYYRMGKVTFWCLLTVSFYGMWTLLFTISFLMCLSIK